VGFVVRPIGGLLFGIMGDRYGRKPVLVATLLMIGIGTTLIGVLPTYAQIGVWAPVLLVAMRVIQGLGAGAEYGGAVAEAVVATGKVERNPAMEALRQHPRNFFVVLGARMAENGLGYFFPVFGLSYVISTLGVPKSEALSALMLAFVIELFAILGWAALSDRIGRRPVYMFGALAGVALAFPFFWMVGTKEWIWIALAFILARAVVTAAMFGPQAAYFAELFPPQRRFAGFAFARELGSLLAG